MRRLGVLVLTACGAREAAPDPELAMPEPPVGYPIQPVFRSATGGPIHIRNDVAQLDVPYAPGLTLRAAFRIAGVPGLKSATLLRSELAGVGDYELPVAAIFGGQAPDLGLAPGDQIIIFEDLCSGSASICD